MNESFNPFFFATFVVTIVPFYHGMERHLFETHLAKQGINFKRNGIPSPLLIYIFVFIIEGVLLIAMARNIDNAFVFIKAWTLLLIVDIV